MQRVSVVGPSGSGKSTFSRALALALDAPWIELDALHHQPGWVPRPLAAFQADLAGRLTGPRWVVDGSYADRARALVWPRADTVVWLDLPRRVVLPALLARTLRRGLLREELWNGNREAPLQVLDPRPEHNIVLWSLRQFGTYPPRMARDLAAHPHLRLLRLRSRAEVAATLDAARPLHRNFF